MVPGPGILLWRAILAVLVATPSTLADGETLPEPIAVVFQTTAGRRVTGRLASWDESGFDGTFGRVAWHTVIAEDLWQLHMRVMDRADGVQWARLGCMLLLQAPEDPVASPKAERAFRQAIRLDETMVETIEVCRASAAGAHRRREAARQDEVSQRLRTVTPEAGGWSADPWPDLSDEDRLAAVATMKGDARRMLKAAGVRLAPLETRHYLLYTDLPPAEATRWAGELDAMHVRLMAIFELSDEIDIFWGKAVIFVFSDRERFRLVEAESFGYDVPEWVAGVCHPVGPKVFVDFYRQPDVRAFASVLVHETVHGFMHRYRTPLRLPTWANEGFADWVASVVVPGEVVDRQRRPVALDFVRRGGRVRTVLDMTYTDGSWPGEDGEGYAVGYMLVGRMIADNPRGFGRWVNAVKAGEDWAASLEPEFGVTPDVLAERFTRYYRVND